MPLVGGVKPGLKIQKATQGQRRRLILTPEHPYAAFLLNFWQV
ncbi:hypothetical protein SEEC0006_01715 [Salmonella enterica subsp. enterica serovar Choleraesuis str. 0006]|nr:hypothetical protein SEEC0006_01715 [Salmonella enterica subsp. enterica serovar Choleraesuis str. 0006]